MVKNSIPKQKTHQKLARLAKKAEICLDRKEAQKLIRKADKAHAKIQND